jgi:3alpha(or 20beta)-hydroxysteroid dehydrogenase
MAGNKNGLVITGGASGIGAATIKAALARGWPVSFCDVVAKEKVDPSLLTEKSVYVQANVTKSDEMARFRDETVKAFAAKGISPERLNVVACAGISRRGDPVQVQLMKDINEGGTANLLNAFAQDLKGGKGLFVGLCSIVAAEGIAVKGDEEYKLTKAEALRIATEEGKKLGVEGFAVAPGAIDTPMTRHEAIFGMLLLGAARIFGADKAHPLHQDVLKIAGVPEGSTPGAVLVGLLGKEIASLDDFKIVADTFEKDPQLSMAGVMRFTAFIARSAEVLTKLDVVIGPEVVARLTLDQFEQGKAPSGGLLRAYSAKGDNRITQLLGAFAG